jgi:hypothetical protein
VNEIDIVALLVAIGLIIAVVLALLLKRHLRIRWGNKEIEANPQKVSNSSMCMEATGHGSKIKRARQHDESGSASMEIKAERGGQVLDAEMRSKKGDSKE